MKKTFRKVSALVLTFLMIIGMLPAMGSLKKVNAAETDGYTAFLMYCDGSWGNGHWNADDTSATTTVTGSGTYSVKYDVPAAVEGAQVFCVDILGYQYHMDSVGSVVTIKDVKVLCDGTEIAVDQEKVVVGDIEEKGNLRIEIYNPGGGGATADKPPIDSTALKATKSIEVQFTVVEQATQAFLMYCDASWGNGNWAPAESDPVVNGSGTYTVKFAPEAECTGLQVFCVDIKGYQKKAEAQGKKVSVKDVVVKADGNVVALDASKLVIGDIEENGNLRIEINNPGGGGKTKENPPFDPATLKFSQSLEVTFTIEESGEPEGFLMFGDRSWAIGNLSDESKTETVAITGAGTYTVNFDATKNGGDGTAQASGAQVFCVDLRNFNNWAKANGKQFEIKDVKITADGADFAFDASKIKIGDLEENGNLRIELYNEYGSTKEDPAFAADTLKFAKTLSVTFTVVEQEIQSYIIFADNNWKYAVFDGSANNSVKFTGNGTYTMTLKAADVKNDATEAVAGAQVFCVDIKGLHNAIEHIGQISVTDVKVKADGVEVAVDQAKVKVGDIEKNGNIRIEIANKYGETKDAPSIDQDAFTFADTLEVSYTISGVHFGRNCEVEKVEEGPTEPFDETLLSKDYNAYLVFQCPDTWVYRDDWSNETSGLLGFQDGVSKYFNQVTYNGGETEEEKNLGGVITDAVINGNGTYTIKIEGFEAGLKGSEKWNMLYASLTIPYDCIERGGVTITDATLKIDGKKVNITPLITKGDEVKTKNHSELDGIYTVVQFINGYNSDNPNAKDSAPIPQKSIEMTFTIAGLAKDGTPAETTPAPTQAPAAEDTPAPTQAPAENTPAPTQAPAANNSNGSLTPIIIVIVVCVVVIAAVVIVIVRKNKKH